MDSFEQQAQLSAFKVLPQVLGHMDIEGYMHEMMHRDELSKPIIDRPSRELLSLSYKERLRLFNVFKTAEGREIVQGRSDTHLGSAFLLASSIPYPRQILSSDRSRLALMVKVMEPYVDQLDRAIMARDRSRLSHLFTEASFNLTHEILGWDVAGRVAVYTHEKKAYDKERVKTAGFNWNGPTLEIGFNVSDDAFRYSDYYRSGVDVAGVIIHEISHLDQHIRFLEPSLVTLIDGRLLSRSAGNFIRFGNKTYLQPEVNLLGYLANSKERQARFRQLAAVDMLNGRPVRSEREYFMDYTKKDTPPKLRAKMQEIAALTP